jgi:hypothetical protein
MVMVCVPAGEFLMGSSRAQMQAAVPACAADGYNYNE